MKIVNLILGIAAAIILSALISLGIKAFYPAPIAPTYPDASLVVPCASGNTQCIAADQNASTVAQNQFNTAQDSYNSAMQVYDRNLFIIANIIGIIVFAIVFLLVFASALAARGVPIGIMLAGLYSILYGYAVGWGSVGDQLKFFIGLVIAVLILGGSMWLMQKKAKSN